jgi:copper chaperone CopZ
MKCLKVLLALACLAVTATSAAATIEMTVSGLVCAFCAQGIEKRLKKFPAAAEIVVNFEQRLVAVALKGGQDIPDADLRRALTDAGYTVKSIARSETPLAEVRERFGRDKP